ncbi:hypothetical protein Tco_1263145 [Tanacetum coccineum]
MLKHDISLRFLPEPDIEERHSRALEEFRGGRIQGTKGYNASVRLTAEVLKRTNLRKRARMKQTKIIGNGNEIVNKNNVNGNKNENREEENVNAGGNAGGAAPVARACTYKDFLNCQHHNFSGTKGVVGLARWFEKMEFVFCISNWAISSQVNFATCTLLDGALTWWNSHVHTVGIDEAYEMSWKYLMKMVPEEDDKIERRELTRLETMRRKDMLEVCLIVTSASCTMMDRVPVYKGVGTCHEGSSLMARDCRTLCMTTTTHPGDGNKLANGESEEKSDLLLWGGWSSKPELQCLSTSTLIDIVPTTLDVSYAVELADGKVIAADTILRVVSPPIVATSNVVTPNAEKTNDGFQTVGKTKKRKGKSKSTNGGQFTGPSVKHNVRYEPKVTTSAPKKGTTYVGYTSQSTPMLKTTGNSSKKDNLSMSNSFSALNEEEEEDEEDVENMYDESANLIQNTKAGGRSSFTVAAG